MWYARLPHTRMCFRGSQEHADMIHAIWSCSLPNKPFWYGRQNLLWCILFAQLAHPSCGKVDHHVYCTTPLTTILTQNKMYQAHSAMMNARGKVITAALVWTGKAFEEFIQIRSDSYGKIIEIGKNIVQPGEEVLDLGNKALVPGFVNAHSHAFHRQMRGRSQIGTSASESFWKWRDEMYAVVEGVNYTKLYEYSLATFKEMLSAGITTVGEFHYVHHGTESFELDKAVLEAARDAGIRIVLIDTLYYRAGFDAAVPLANAQKRFEANFDDFIKSIKKLENLKTETQTIAVAAHSLRAVSLEDSVKLAKWSSKNNKPIHIHIEEQPQEIKDCLKATGNTPSDLVLSHIAPTNATITAVHCTYTSKQNMQSFGNASVNVCICPLTEGYLGDGIPEIVDESRISIGTDCNNRISMLEELRSLTYSQHTKLNRRSAFGLDASKLLRIATQNGAVSLGLQDTIGVFENGKQLDYIAFNLESPRIMNPASELLDAIIFGAGNEDISSVAVSGITAYSS